MTADEILQALSEAQHGVFTTAHAIGRGVSLRQLKRRRESGRLVWLSPIVLHWRGAPLTDAARILAAVFDAGPDAAASHWTAAQLWGLPVTPSPGVHVVAPGRAARAGGHLAILHEPRGPLIDHCSEIDGIAVTTPARVLLDIANLRGVHRDRLERLTDATLARGLTTLPRLQRTLDDVAVRGRRGVVVMRELVRARVKGLKPTESGLEFRFHQLAKFAALSGFERQVDVGDDHDWIGRVDFLHRRFQLIVECDTALHHGSLFDQRRDEERRARYEATGWRVEVFTDIDLFYRRDEVIDRLRRLRQRPVSGQLAG
jgi:very-short-patch-repair endonuclease